MLLKKRFIMAIIKVEGIEDIKYLDKMVNKGSFGEIYPFSDDTYFKKLNRSQGSLGLLDNQIRLEILTDLMNLKGSKYLILPKDIYVTEECLLGYTSLIKKAKSIRDMSLDSNYGDVIKAFKLLCKDIALLADKNIFDCDFNQYNILFDGKMYLLDFDQSIYVENDNHLYKRMVYELFQSLYLSLVKDGFGSRILMEKDLEGLIQTFKSYTSTNYDLFFELLRWKLEFYTRMKINTVGDFRKSLSLTKKG